MTNNIGSVAYNQYQGFSDFSYNCIEFLVNNNELIWKLIKYDDRDAWHRGDLSKVEKTSMIYNGEEDSTNARIFLDIGQPDAWTHENTILRISPHSIFPENRSLGTISMLFEVYSHYKINHLSNYKTRIDYITEELIAVFNGINIGGIGRLYLDRLALFDSRVIPSGQIPFKGRWMLFGNKSG